MSSFFAALICIGFACAPSVNGAKTSNNGGVDETFDAFMKRHGRSYNSDSVEYGMRLSLFEKRQNEVREHNGKSGQSYKVTLNHFSDLTNQERKVYLGLRPTVKKAPAAASLLDTGTTTTIPDHMDWSTDQNSLSLPLTVSAGFWNVAAHGHAVPRIPDQGSCGSCWAVTTAGMMEAHYEIHQRRKDLTFDDANVKEFSAQDLVNCVPNPNSCGGAGGCEGSTVELAMDYIMNNGLDEESQTPYEGETNNCGKPGARSNPLDESDTTTNPPTQIGGTSSRAMLPAYMVTGYTTLTAKTAEELKEAMYTHGPIALSVAAGSWFSYSSGIFTNCAVLLATEGMVIDHAVLGYGYASDYWKIRNSWGADWGESGFIRIARTNLPALSNGTQAQDEDSHCERDLKPETGTGCLNSDGNPTDDEILVCGMCGLLWDSVYPTFNANTADSTLQEMQTIVVDSDAVVRKSADTDAI